MFLVENSHDLIWYECVYVYVHTLMHTHTHSIYSLIMCACMWEQLEGIDSLPPSLGSTGLRQMTLPTDISYGHPTECIPSAEGLHLIVLSWESGVPTVMGPLDPGSCISASAAPSYDGLTLGSQAMPYPCDPLSCRYVSPASNLGIRDIFSHFLWPSHAFPVRFGAGLG